MRPGPLCWLTDMDGVLVREEHALPGAAEFLQRLVDKKRPFLVLTNNSIFTPRDLAARLARSGLDRAGGGDLDLGVGHRDVPARPTAWRFGLRHRRGGADDRVARGRIHAHRRRPRFRGARRDPDLLVRGDHQGHSADSRRRPVHRHQPGRHRAIGRGPVAGDRVRRRADHEGHRAGTHISSASPIR